MSRTQRVLQVLLAGLVAAALGYVALAGQGAYWPLILFVAGGILVFATLSICRGMFTQFEPETPEIFVPLKGQGPVTDFAHVLGGFDLSRAGIAGALVVTSVIVAIYGAVGFVPGSAGMPAKLAGYGVIGLAAALASAGLIVVFQVGRRLDAFGRCHRFELPFHNYGILRLGRLLHRSFLLILLTVMPFQMTGLFVGSTRPSLENFNSPVMLMIGYPVVLFLLLMFCLSQFSFHQQILLLKRTRLLEIDKALSRTEGQGQAEHRMHLFAEIDRIEHMPDWPTSTFRLSQAVITSICLPLLPLGVDRLIP